MYEVRSYSKRLSVSGNGSDDEGHLIRRVQTGTPAEAAEAFEQLVIRHGSHLLLYLRSKGLTRAEQDDVASETWLRAWQKIWRFQYRGIDLFPWLRKIADFVILERFKARYTGEPPAEISEAEEALAQADPGPSAIEQLSREEYQRAIEQVLPEAPADYREVINAKFNMEFDPEEIAQLLGWSVNKVYVTTHRALDWLRQRLRERYGPNVIKDWLS